MIVSLIVNGKAEQTVDVTSVALAMDLFVGKNGESIDSRCCCGDLADKAVKVAFTDENGDYWELEPEPTGHSDHSEEVE